MRINHTMNDSPKNLIKTQWKTKEELYEMMKNELEYQWVQVKEKDE